MRMLVAMDGSEHALRALRHVLDLAARLREPVELHLLNVQPPVTFGSIKRHVSPETLNAYYQEEGAEALAPARKLLVASSLPHTDHVAVGPVAESIVHYAREHDCRQIVMGARGLGAMSGLLLGSVALKVLQLSDVPVTLVK